MTKFVYSQDINVLSEFEYVGQIKEGKKWVTITPAKPSVGLVDKMINTYWRKHRYEMKKLEARILVQAACAQMSFSRGA